MKKGSEVINWFKTQQSEALKQATTRHQQQLAPPPQPQAHMQRMPPPPAFVPMPVPVPMSVPSTDAPVRKSRFSSATTTTSAPIVPPVPPPADPSVTEQLMPSTNRLSMLRKSNLPK